MSDLKVGDVVRLKSGDPAMTIYSIIDNGCYCTWFDDNNHKVNDVFNLLTLKLIES